MKWHVDTTLIDEARNRLLVIRDHSAEAERQRRLSRTVLDALTDAVLLRLCTPRSLGGLEVDPLTCARVVEEVAGADSAAELHRASLVILARSNAHVMTVDEMIVLTKATKDPGIGVA